MTTARHLSKAAKIILAVFAIVLGLGLIIFLIEGVYPAGLETTSVKRVEALLYNTGANSDLPADVQIILDGAKADFHRDTAEFNRLVKLLHEDRSEKMLTFAGPYPAFSDRHRCGEISVSSYYIRSHFAIARSGQNPNFYWIALPKQTTQGTTFPMFTFDPAVIDLIKTTALAQRSVKDLR